jgi:hypothetical protein
VALKLFSDSFDISTQITATPEQLQVRQNHLRQHWPLIPSLTLWAVLVTV